MAESYSHRMFGSIYRCTRRLAGNYEVVERGNRHTANRLLWRKYRLHEVIGQHKARRLSFRATRAT